MTPRPSPLDEPDYAAFAWDRYKRLMRWMTLASFAAVVIGLAALYLIIGPIPIHMAIATAGGVFFSVLLAAALMGLVFLSSGSGHDETIEDPFKEEA
jgi:predicted ABC-type exoprotein transport system permease subunit